MPARAGRRTDGSRTNPEAIRALERRDAAAMLALAADPATPPEMLVVLSQSDDPHIRAAVAGNSATPSALGDVLAGDDDASVRIALAKRIAGLLPELEGRESARVAARATAVLTRLAEDADEVVRRALAQSVCRLTSAPKDLILSLARDIDSLVAVPVCEFSPLLDDDDLIALISAPGTPTALAAIARRDGLGADVSDRLASTGDVDAIVALLENRTAQIREATLETIVDLAASVERWHETLCTRPEINEALAQKLAAFVAGRLIEQLSRRNDLGQACRDELRTLAHEAIRRRDAMSGAEFVAVPTVDEIVRAIGNGRENRLYTLIAARGNLSSRAVRRIFLSRQPKAIVALSRKVGLPMEAAERLQRYPGFVADADVIRPGRGGRYPMSEKDMDWQLAAFGVTSAAGADHPTR